jgi:hypothetical protein
VGNISLIVCVDAQNAQRNDGTDENPQEQQGSYRSPNTVFPHGKLPPKRLLEDTIAGLWKVAIWLEVYS